MKTKNQGHTHILWTGGWDSTFRIVQLARAGKEVQPHYIADHSRASISKEISVMHEARQTINHRFRGAHIREVYVQDLSRIRIYDDFSAAYQSLRSRGWIGSQYKYIASYARMKGIKRLELSIERGNQGDTNRTNIPRAENTVVDQHGHRVISSKAPEDLKTLFGSFSFPIVELTKNNMRELAREWGQLDILNQTWFCHQPFLGQPCGSCNPCMHTFEAGLGYRFTGLSRARYRVKKTIMAYPRAHKLLSRIKYGHRYF